MHSKNNGPFRFVVIGGLGIIAGMVGILVIGDLRFRLAAFLLFYLLAFTCYALAAWQAVSAAAETRTYDAPARNAKSVLWSILGVAVICRLLLLPAALHLSDDIYRYLWDGRVWSAGINPYAFAPADLNLAALRDRFIFPYINHAEVPTIYPPVLQFVFRLAYALSPTVAGWKCLAVLFDFGIIFLLYRLLQCFQLDQRLLLIYAWNPLVLLEIAGSGHGDIIGVFFITVAFALSTGRRPWYAITCLVAATLTKFVAVLVLPFLLWPYRWRRALGMLLFFFALLVVAYLPFYEPGISFTRALHTYTIKWQFNASIFALLADVVMAVHPTDDLDANFLLAKYILGAAFAVFFVYRFLRWRSAGIDRPLAIWREWTLLFGALVCFAPTLHPWYLVWLVPAMVFYPQRAWLLLTGTVVFSYWVLGGYAVTGEWVEPKWVRWLEYAPFYALLAWDSMAGWRRNRSILP